MKTLRSKLEPTASENYMCANVLRGCLKIPHLLYHAKANSTTVKNLKTNKFMPCKIYLQVWILEFVGPLAPPAPHRLPRKELFLGNLSVIMRLEFAISCYSGGCELSGILFNFRKLVKPRKMFLFFSISFHPSDLSPNYQL